jgi:pyruvate dehydrogenase E1 component alpha subunit
MPRKEIDLPYRVDYLSILDQDGKVDEELEPDLSEEFLLSLHRAMLLARRFDERMLTMQRQGKIGTFGPIKGQEASQLGAVAVLDAKDWLVPAFREMGAELYRGKKMEDVLLAYGGYNEGACVSEDLNNLPVAIPVATQTLHAVGIAYGMKYRQQKQIAMTFFGDGATSEGDFHEAMNFAGVFQLPLVFVCQNNQWAISIPRSKQTKSKTLAQKALAYGIPSVQVDGNDILAVYTAAKEAADRAKSGQGPTMLENITYRMSVHTTADDPTRYRTEEETEEWAGRDPITRFQKYLISKDLLSESQIDDLEQEIKEEIRDGQKRFDERAKELGGPAAMFDHTFAELPPALVAQKEEAGRHVSEE